MNGSSGDPAGLRQAGRGPGLLPSVSLTVLNVRLRRRQALCLKIIWMIQENKEAQMGKLRPE
jgi:hypothetical protein